MAINWEDFWGTVDWDNEDDTTIAGRFETFKNAHPTELDECLNVQNDAGLSGVYLAVQHSKEKTLERLLELGAKTELGTEKGLPSALAIAFREKDTNLAKMLIEHGANTAIDPVPTWNAEQKAAFKETSGNIWSSVDPSKFKEGRAMEAALERGDTTMAMVFACRGAPINNRQDGKPSAMDIAIQSNNLKMVNYLLHVSGNSFDVNDTNAKGNTFLNEALNALPDSKDIVKRLIHAGADVNKPDPADGKNWAILCERMENATSPENKRIVQEIAKMMMDKGITVDGTKTPQEELVSLNLTNTSPSDELKKFDFLLRMGVLKKVNEEQLSAGKKASGLSIDDLEAIKGDANADYAQIAKTWISEDLAVNDKGESATKVCFDTIQSSTPDRALFGRFLNLGMDANAQNAEGNTFLHEIAGKIKDPALAEGFIDDLSAHALDVNRRNKDSMTPLMRAISEGNIAVADKLLARSDVDVKAQDKDLMTALHYAVMKNDRTAVEEILKKGALVDAQTKDGDTALHMAARKGYMDIAKILIGAGADINKKNNKNNTPIAITRELHPEFEKDMQTDRIEQKWENIGKKYGVVFGPAIKCGGKAVEKTCRAIANMFNSNSKGR